MIGQYENGNYTVKIFEDGTKIRENELDNLTPAFPESIDLKITNYCNLGCPMCHEDSSVKGKHADIMNLKFIDSLHPYTELAIGGGNALAHPELKAFLRKVKEKNIISNLTINMNHLDYPIVKELINEKLIYGLGISMNDNITDQLLARVSNIPNSVIHIINGVIDKDNLRNLVYSKVPLRILILGYKELRRGEKYNAEHKEELIKNKRAMRYALLGFIDNPNITVSFDNLAIKQLELKKLLPDTIWNKFYMGDDGQYTMYIDAVNKQYASSSVSPNRFDITDDIKEMFNRIRGENNGKQRIESRENKSINSQRATNQI